MSDTWINRAAWIAAQYASLIEERHPNTTIEIDEDRGLSLGHLLRMARMLSNRELDSDTKACRWLGWLQAGLVFNGLTTLDEAKRLNLASGK